MREMKPIYGAVVALFCSASWVQAASFADADAPLVCAVVDLASCEPGDGCRRETADTMNAPQLVTIDRKGQEITGQRPDGRRLSTKIDSVTRKGDLLVLDGVQDELSWTITIAEGTGRMSLAAVGDGIAFSVFGSCEAR
jgi:hypothetical protein